MNESGRVQTPVFKPCKCGRPVSPYVGWAFCFSCGRPVVLNAPARTSSGDDT